MKRFFKNFKHIALTLATVVIATASINANAAALPVANTQTSTPASSVTVMVNRAANCVTVYLMNAQGVNVPVKAMVCSVGREGHPTPLGTFKTSDYYVWRQLVDGSYGRYAVRFNKGILFHSVPYTKTSWDALKWEQYNLLGQPASLGCVRLSVNDAKWIYDYVPKGSTVIVYDDALNPGPLGKPVPATISPDSLYKTWDPTDPVLLSYLSSINNNQ